MSALNLKLARDLWHIRGQALAIAVVIGCGVAVFVMALSTIRSLDETRTAYYERYRFAEVFASVKRAPEWLTGRIGDIPGVKSVAARIVVDVSLDLPAVAEPITGRLISLPERAGPTHNDFTLRSGRMLAPGRADEAVVSRAFAEAHRLAPGNQISAILNGHKRRLTIVSIALSPEYVYAIAPGAIIPDNSRFGVLWMGRKALAAAYDLDGAFNDVSLTLLRGALEDDVIRRLDDILEPYGGVGAYGRGDQVSNWYLSSEIEQLGHLARHLPPIFLAVAVFLLHMVVSRLIATEREQIGVLKAFGYTDGEVGWHYLKLVMAIVGAGVVFGSATGAGLGRGLTELYAEFFQFPLLYYRPGTGVFAVAALVSFAAGGLGALGAVRRAVTLPPAEAMAPPAPTMYRRSWWDRGGAIGALAEPTRMIVRHIARWPVRAALTTLGIAMAVSILVTTMQWIDAIDHILEVYYFQAQRQDVSITFVEPQASRTLIESARLPGVVTAEPFRRVPARLRLGPRHRREAIAGISAGAQLTQVLDAKERALRMPPDGLVLSTMLAKLLGAEPGDVLTVEVMEGRRPVRRIRVAALMETSIGTPAYMDLGALNRMMGEGPTLSGIHLLVDSQRQDEIFSYLKTTPAVAGVMARAGMIQSFRETLAETTYIMVSFLVLFGGLVAFGVIYNSARISLSERGRELATLRVLGFTRFEVSYILLGELALLVVVALPLGCLIGYGISWGLTQAFETELYRIPLVIERSTYGMAATVGLVAAVVSGLIVRARLDRLDLVAVLKTRE